MLAHLSVAVVAALSPFMRISLSSAVRLSRFMHTRLTIRYTCCTQLWSSYQWFGTCLSRDFWCCYFNRTICVQGNCRMMFFSQYTTSLFFFYLTPKYSQRVLWKKKCGFITTWFQCGFFFMLIISFSFTIIRFLYVNLYFIAYFDYFIWILRCSFV